jgi:hypothetical protein
MHSHVLGVVRKYWRGSFIFMFYWIFMIQFFEVFRFSRCPPPPPSAPPPPSTSVHLWAVHAPFSSFVQTDKCNVQVIILQRWFAKIKQVCGTFKFRRVKSTSVCKNKNILSSEHLLISLKELHI